MNIFDQTPGSNYRGHAPEMDFPPSLVEVPAVRRTDIIRSIGKTKQMVTAAIVIVVDHCVSESLNYGLSDIYVHMELAFV